MKSIVKASLRLLVAGIMMFFSVGCREKKTEGQTETKLLIVERQRVEIYDSELYDFTITADVPVQGSDCLVDSLMMFLNHQLYDVCSGYCPETIPFEHMYCNNGHELLEQYDEAFASCIAEEGFDISLSYRCLLIAQTESFVTYGIESYHCGGSCGSELYCFTFNKKDGCRVANIIKGKDLLRFIKDHPREGHPFGQWQLESKDIDEWMSAGLTENGLLVVNEDQVNHYVAGLLEYEMVKPYLSKEAQHLVGLLDQDSKYNRDDWYLGSCVGEVKDTHGNIFRLMQREPLWRGFSDFDFTDAEVFLKDKVYSLTAYENSDESNKPVALFNLDDDRYTSRLEFAFPEAAWEGPSFDEVLYILDDCTLYVPYLKKAYQVDCLQFKYDGQHFKAIRPEETRPVGKVIGWVVSAKNDSICLVEGTNVESFSTNVGGIGLAAEGISAYYFRNHLYVPARIFPYQSATLQYIPGDEPMVTSNPNGDYYAFDPKERKIYTVISEKTSLGGWGSFDRYDVFRFQGEEFVFEGEDGGFWLHPSIRQFGRLFFIGKTKDYLVRIDEMRSYEWRGLDEEDYETSKIDTCRYRYSAWKHKDNMLDAPDLVVENGYFGYWDNSLCYVFENDGYQYVVDTETHMVYHNGKKILEQKLRVLEDVFD